MKLTVKNMVCSRCVAAVDNIVRKIGLTPVAVSLGEVILEEDALTDTQLARLDSELLAVGFERIDDKKVRLIEKLKSTIIERIHHTEKVDVKFNWSSVLSDVLKYDYNYLSSLFSSVQGITLEQYIILQKIERVKELLFYDELTMNEIADRLGYSSVQHLSTQFRKVTGSTPTAYKRSHTRQSERRTLDSI